MTETLKGPHMRRSRARELLLVVGLALSVLWPLASASVAAAQTYSDVPPGQWAQAAIDWVTNFGPAGDKLLDDYDGVAFRPDQAITRAQLARALVVACGHQADDVLTPVPLADVPPEHPYWHDIQVALKLKLLSATKGEFLPDQAALAWQVDRAVVRTLKVIHPGTDWTMLTTLYPTNWQPNPGWKTGAPQYLGTEVAARFLGLRFNHPAAADAEELSPRDPMGRDEVAFLLWKALNLPAWRLDALSRFDAVTLPPLSDLQKQIVAFALRYVGYPYVWGGEYPTPDSPYGVQAHGGFDCSGFVWWVMKMNFHCAIPDTQRTAAQMAAAAKPRITRAKLQPGDIIFFGPDGPQSTAASIYHTGIYLGNGWFIHSTGSADGVSLASLHWSDWVWRHDFAWGRRLTVN